MLKRTMGLLIAITTALMAVSSPAVTRSGKASEGATPVNTSQSATSPETAMSNVPLIYVVRYRPGEGYLTDRPLLQQDLRQHAEYMCSQTQNGTIIAAGPTFGQAGGLVLIGVSNREEADAFVRNDPAVMAGIFVGEVTDWRPAFDRNSIFRRSPN